jgi:hypothetical protein
MVEITYQVVLSTLQTIALIVGIAYYLFIMRNSQRNQEMTLKNRQAQLLMQMWNRTQSKEFTRDLNTMAEMEWKDYDDFSEKYSPKSNPEAVDAWVAVGNFCEGLGVLVKNDLIEPSLVDDLESHTIVHNWEKFSPIIFETRKRYNFPTAFEQWEYLYNQVAPIYYQQHPEIKT